VFVTAAFAYTGTELVGLAAAETKNPEKEIPRASKQVALRIFIFYIVNLFLIGLIVPANSELYSGDGPTSRHSPFVIAIQLAGIKVLPSIFNAVILIAVMSVANSCTFGSTRTIQALAANGMYSAKTTIWRPQANNSNRHGTQVHGQDRQEGSPYLSGHHSAPLRLPGIHQPGRQRW
jgi:amino acid permease